MLVIMMILPLYHGLSPHLYFYNLRPSMLYFFLSCFFIALGPLYNIHVLQFLFSFVFAFAVLLIKMAKANTSTSWEMRFLLFPATMNLNRMIGTWEENIVKQKLKKKMKWILTAQLHQSMNRSLCQREPSTL